MQRLISFVYPVTRTDFIKKSVETLYKYTDNSKFNLIIVDQSIEGLDKEWIDKYVHLYIRMKNQGFAKAVNEGIVHALRWQVPYICVANDDTEFMYSGWLENALEEFKSDPHIMAVCPESPRVPMWGYGLNNGEQVDILPYKETYSEEDINYLKSGNYNKDEIQGRYEFKIPESFPFTKRGVIDGIAMWMPIFKRESFIELGMFEEKFVWGGGEDYDMLSRAYSCAWPIERDECNPELHRRMISTMKSWVWHWWGQSTNKNAEKLDPKLFDGRESWNHLDQLWLPENNDGKNVDPWGHYTDDKGIRRPFKRIPSVQCEPL